MPIFQLTFQDYQNIIAGLNLNVMQAESLGLNTFPMADPRNIKQLYDEYIHRDQRLDAYIRKVSQNCQAIVFAEASRKGNNNYIYRGIRNNFHFKDRAHNYFGNVIEAKWFQSVIIDFFSPIGINHTSRRNESRDYLNNEYLNNPYIYEAYFNNYLHSIMNMIPNVNLQNTDVIIAAPIRTRNSILDYLRRIHHLNNPIKCYRINDRGATTIYDWL
jgi:hypothetical protein